jgi:hypothetical protein
MESLKTNVDMFLANAAEHLKRLDQIESGLIDELKMPEDPINRELKTLRLELVRERRERITDRMCTLGESYATTLAIYGISQSLVRKEDVRVISRRETRRLLTGLIDRLDETTRRRWFRDNFPRQP